MATDLDAQLNHAGNGPTVDHDVVHSQCIKNAVSVAHHACMHEAAPILFVFASQHRREGCAKPFQ